MRLWDIVSLLSPIACLTCLLDYVLIKWLSNSKPSFCVPVLKFSENLLRINVRIDDATELNDHQKVVFPAFSSSPTTSFNPVKSQIRPSFNNI